MNRIALRVRAVVPFRRGWIIACVAALAAVGLVHTAAAHDHSVPWLDESALDAGVFVEVRHPRVIRRLRPIEISVVVSNLAASEPVTVRGLRYRISGARAPITHARDEIISSKQLAYRRFKQIHAQLRALHDAGDSDGARPLLAERERMLAEIRAGALIDRQPVAMAALPPSGSVLEVSVEIDLTQAGVPRTLRRVLRIPVQPPLPGGGNRSWFAGDQHLHTAFSIDAFLFEGTRELISDYADTAQTVGLDWIIVTDHTNIDFLGWYRPWMFAVGGLLAGVYRFRNDYLVLQGQEMGVGALGPLGEPAHLLVYPRSSNSTGFLANPCVGLIANHVNCEPEQVVIDRVNDAGGIGFIAHPFDSGPYSFAAWDTGAGIVGWGGLEIFNASDGRLGASDEQSIGWWHEQLNGIAAPHGGAIPERPDYPTRFPVGLGNSDAHQPAHIGAVFTYANLPGVVKGSGGLPREALMEAFVKGKVVASNGPLVFGSINGAGTGEVAVLPPSGNRLTVSLLTTPEFGPVSDYEIAVYVNGTLRTTLAPAGPPAFEVTLDLDDLLAPPDTFVTLRAERTRCAACPADAIVYQAIANPIWLEFRQQ